MANTIVTVNVSLQLAPTPSTLQRTGALISQGATTTAQGTLTFLTQYSDVTTIIKGALPLLAMARNGPATFNGSITGSVLTASSGLTGTIEVGAQLLGAGVPANTVITSHGTGSGGLGTYNLNNTLSSPITRAFQTTESVTAQAAAAHGFTLNTPVELTISGASPSGYNGTYLCTPTLTNNFVYPLGVNPGANTVAGSYTAESVGELNAMALTFFGQGSSIGVYVLEVGDGGDNNAIAFLSSWLQSNLKTLYTLLVPRTWDSNSNYLALIAQFESPNSLLYFFTTTTLSNYKNYTSLMKDAWCVIEAPRMDKFPANGLTAISSSGGVATATTATAHTVNAGDWFQITGCVPTGYNGWWQAQSGTTGSTLTYNVPADPGTETTLGTLAANEVQQSSAVPSTEFTAAAMMWQVLHDNPSNTFNLAPYAFRFLFGVTPFPKKGLGTLLAQIKAANINTAQLCDEGGISNTAIYWGRTMDGKPFNFWYATDWMQIQGAQALANEVINGSNNPINPLDYDQPGINRLQGRLVATVKSAITFRLALGTLAAIQMDGPAFADSLDNEQFVGQAVVNAVPFIPYSLANPGHYAIGEYDGLSILFTPLRGFESILLNIVASEFVATP